VAKKLLLSSLVLWAVQALPAQAQTAPNPVAVVDAFHGALKSGDADTALRMIAAQADIFEQGFADRSRADYAGAHISSDIAFAKATDLKVVDRHIFWFGDTAACVVTQTRTTGTYQGQPINLEGTETMVLRRSGPSWAIEHIHWSAHPAEAAAPATPAAPAK
jgi:ketosteroid isomerase-like protein